MKKILILFIGILIFLVGCSNLDSDNITKNELININSCNSDYSEKGISCCKDSNSNNICDLEEVDVDIVRSDSSIMINTNNTNIQLSVPIEGKKVFVPKIKEIHELKIDALIKSNFTKVEVEINEIYSNFVLETTDKDTIVEFIAVEFDLFPKDVLNALEFKYRTDNEQKEIDESEIEIEIFESFSKISIKHTSKLENFFVSTTNLDEIIDIIAIKDFSNPKDVRDRIKLGYGIFYDKEQEQIIINKLKINNSN